MLQLKLIYHEERDYLLFFEDTDTGYVTFLGKHTLRTEETPQERVNSIARSLSKQRLIILDTIVGDK